VINVLACFGLQKGTSLLHMYAMLHAYAYTENDRYDKILIFVIEEFY